MHPWSDIPDWGCRLSWAFTTANTPDRMGVDADSVDRVELAAVTDNLPPAGEMRWVPFGAYIVYPRDAVVEMFGHADPASTRKAMTGVHGYPMIKGWGVDEVEWVLKMRDPKLVQAWRDRKRRQQKEET